MRNNLTPKVKKHHKKWTGLDIFTFVVLTIVVIAILIPFWNAAVISFTTNSAYVDQPFSFWPKEFTWANYTLLLENGNGLLIGYKNTIIISVIGTVAGMLVMVMAAYVFSREFPGKRFFFLATIFTMYFGGGLIPTYLNLKKLDLLNTHAGVILLTLCSVYHIIIMKNGFESTPKDLQEAAMIDGATDMTIFWKVMLPLQKPLIATFSLFTFVDLWNDWYWPMLILTDNKKVVLQLYLRTIINSVNQMLEGVSVSEDAAALDAFSAGVQMAALLVVIIPVMCIYPFLQKYFVKGIMVGSVKM